MVLVFGYGSLIWRPGFPFVASYPGTIKGWKRRFWQGSPDHRGTPEAPGRVVTLVKSHADDEVFGVVYHIADEHEVEVLHQLYYREKAGYTDAQVLVACVDGVAREAMVFMATDDNPHFLGEDSVDAIGRQIAVCHGPSGPNREYLFNLRHSLIEHGVHDQHVEDLFEIVTRLVGDAQTLEDDGN